MSPATKNRRWKRVLGWTVAVVIALPVVVWCVLYGESVWQANRANKALLESRNLVPGKSTDYDVKLFVDRYFGSATYIEQECKAAHCRFTLFIRSKLTSRLLDMFYDGPSERLVSRLDYIGLRPWYEEIWFVTESGTLEDVRIMHYLGPRMDRNGLWAGVYTDLWVSDDNTESWRRRSVVGGAVRTLPHFEVSNPHLTTPGGGILLKTIVDRSATEGERNTAFDLQTKCFVRMRRCTTLADLAPGPWKWYAARVPTE